MIAHFRNILQARLANVSESTMPTTVPQDSSPSPKKVILKIVQAVVTLTVLVYLFTFIEWPKVVQTISEMDLRIIWLAPLLLITGMVAAGVRSSFILARFGVHLSRFHGFQYYLVSSFYGVLLPGVLGGDALRIGFIKKQTGGRLSVIVTSALIERALGFLMVLVIGTTSILLAPSESRMLIGSDVYRSLSMATALVLVAAVGGFFFIRYSRWLDGILDRFESKKSIDTLRNLLYKVRELSIGWLLLLALLSGVFQLFDIVTSYVVATALGMEIALHVLLIVIPVVYIATILPISLGGLGVREGVLAFLLARFAVPVDVAVMFAFSIYLNRLLVALIGGAVQFIRGKPVSEG